jgi:hypothetical protein
MRNLLWIAVVSLFLQFSARPSTLLAQDRAMDYGPVTVAIDTTQAIRNDAVVQTGYAVLTVIPFPGAGTTLNATTTVGLKAETGAVQTSFAAPGLATNASIFLDVNERLGRNLGISLVNPGNLPASVTLTIRGGNGVQLSARTIPLAARHQMAGFVTGLVPIPSTSASSSVPLMEVAGTLFLESTAPISITAVRFGGSTFSTVPVTNLGTTSSLPAMPSGLGGSDAHLLPLFVAGRGWATQIALSNPGNSPVVFRLDFFKSDGTVMNVTLNGMTGASFINLAVAGGGAILLAPRDAKGETPF